MGMIQGTGRFFLFGWREVPSRIVEGMAKDLEDVPAVGSQLAEMLRAWWFGGVDVPARLFKAIDSVLASRGGEDKEGNKLFWPDKRKTYQNPAAWVVGVDYAGADANKVNGMEYTLEDKLHRAGYSYNVRILHKPLRIEVDKPNPPMVRLSDLWSTVLEMPTDKLLCCPGVHWSGKNEQYLQLPLLDLSVAIFGIPGSGKTQVAMAMLLTLAAANSPDKVSMVICDPKVVDFQALRDLPHLACEIATDAEECADRIADVVAEMDKRKADSKTGADYYKRHFICLYVDEMSELLDSLDDDRAKVVAEQVKRLTQAGRGLGIIVIGASQRAVDLNKKMYSKMPLRIVGKSLDASDSVFASGIAGVQCHKLPGKGSFEIYGPGFHGERIQGLFVADQRAKDYDKQVGVFINSIKERWGGVAPAYRIVDDTPLLEDKSLKLDDAQAAQIIRLIQNSAAINPDITIEEAQQQVLSKEDRLLSACNEWYERKGEISKYRIRLIHEEVFKKQMSNDDAKVFYNAHYGELHD